MALKLPLESGKTYRTRDGMTVKCTSIMSDLAAFMSDDGWRNMHTGRWSAGAELPSDIVEGPVEDDMSVTLAPSALDVQEGGDHYRTMGLQPWEALDHWLTHEQHLGYLLGSAIAYLGRYNAAGAGKGGTEDVKKARHYLQRMEEVAAREVPESEFVKAVKHLCVCARTTSGRDEGLCAALDRVEAALNSNPPR